MIAVVRTAVIYTRRSMIARAQPALALWLKREIPWYRSLD